LILYLGAEVMPKCPSGEAASLGAKQGEGDGRERRMEVAAQLGSASTGEKKGLTCRVHLIEREERERNQLGRREPKRKTHFCGDTIDTWARWAHEEGFGLRGREAGGAGWAKGQVGR
jgi:hypothetical protein